MIEYEARLKVFSEKEPVDQTKLLSKPMINQCRLEAYRMATGRKLTGKEKDRYLTVMSKEIKYVLTL